MTEEAFIRAVVDSPGQDTPRLVYADWLDDHGDAARAAFLRAEAAWAAPWRTGTPPGWSARRPGRAVPEWGEEPWPGLDDMLARAVGLDRLWVARVSRPPVGVCCDHLQFRNPGPPLTAADLGAAEAASGCPFPPTLTAFLLHTNGGSPNRNQLVYRLPDGDDGEWDWISLDWFARVGPGNAGTVASLRGEIEYLGTELGAFDAADLLSRFVPFGHTNELYVLLIAAHTPVPGAVYRLDTQGEDAQPEPLVPSLPQLLARIVTEGI